MDVRADRDRCIGAGNCALVAPAVFDQGDDDGLVVVLVPTPPPEDHDAVQRAVEQCPAGALTTH